MPELTRPPPDLLTIKQAMACAHISRQTIYLWIKQQRITVDRTLPKHPRIVASSLPGIEDFEVAMSSATRWQRLSVLLLDFARCVEASARLDAYVAVDDTIGKHHQGLLAFDAKLTHLEARLDRELDRLTVERGRIDLLLKQQRDLDVAALAVAG